MQNCNQSQILESDSNTISCLSNPVYNNMSALKLQLAKSYMEKTGSNTRLYFMFDRCEIILAV